MPREFEWGDALASDAPGLQDWPTGVAQVAPGWQPLLQNFLDSAEGQQLGQRLRERIRSGAVVYPPQPLRALALTPPEQVRVVILGQDPYHGPGQANGLAFAVAPGVRVPPSLRNIFKELARDGVAARAPPSHLEHWARQGVLLLNTSLTVEAGQAASHARLGWQALTHAVLAHLKNSAAQSPRVFMLWGAHAQAHCPPEVQAARAHLWLLANHPSPLSALRPPAPFIGCGHFRQANAFLQAHGAPPIDWLGAA
ncbi:MAG: uracil-DNA glycosylase [Burkholderiaceae bacterium]|nr:uracil-DNA glycosylase [Burkholderiaceae bacterium]